MTNSMKERVFKLSQALEKALPDKKAQSLDPKDLEIIRETIEEEVQSTRNIMVTPHTNSDIISGGKTMNKTVDFQETQKNNNRLEALQNIIREQDIKIKMMITSKMNLER
jgi:hypothetical protein